MNAAVFLDRDNTLIHNDGDLGDPEQVRLMQGAASAVASLCGLGFKVVVVTNQGGVARGRYGEADVHAVHERIQELIRRGANGATIDGFYYCPFHPEGTVRKYKKEHPNRKPQPGMLLQAAEEMNLDLSISWMIGDQMRDVQAGAAAGVRTILLREDAEQLSPLDVQEVASIQADEGQQRPVKPDFIARSLVEAVRIVAQQRNKRELLDVRPPEAVPRKWDAAAVARIQRGDRPAVLNEPSPRSEPSRDEQGATASPGATSTPASTAKPSVPPGKKPFRPLTLPVEPPPSPASPPAREDARRSIGTSQPQEQDVRTMRPPARKPPASDVDADVAANQAMDEVEDEVSVDDSAAGELETILQRRASPRLTNSLLRQILQELRNQHAAHRQFTFTSIFAIVLQAAAAVCFLAALMMGGGDPFLFTKLAATAIVIQLAAIGILLTTR